MNDKLITVKEAQDLQTNWNENQGKGIKSRGLKDVREFLFSLEELQEYIDHVKTKSAEQGITKPGIRIYFGAYAGDKENKSTVFLAPTQSTESAESNDKVLNNYEISPLNTVMGGYPPTNY